MEQNFVYEWLGQNLGAILLVSVIPLGFVLIYALLAILLELKVASWVQDRLGPMRTGWKGVLQPIAEVFKLLQKEDITPDGTNKPLFNLAPFIMFVAAYAAYAVLPFSSVFVPAGIDLGLFFIFAVGALAIIGIVMGGWASNNKYSILGAMRAASQMVSYEIPAAIVLLAIAALSGTLNMQEIIAQQGGGMQNWFIFGGAGGVLGKVLITPVMIMMFLLYFVASLAETNRTPFDIPEGESEIVAGYHTEYSGMKFAMFFFAEYSNMFIVAALTAILFFGGWQSPFGDFLNHPALQSLWMMLKAGIFVFVQIWLRWTLPRFRVDQLMELGWKTMVPIAFVGFFAVALWAMVR